jgi:hypothetical protein
MHDDIFWGCYVLLLDEILDVLPLVSLELENHSRLSAIHHRDAATEGFAKHLLDLFKVQLGI